MNNLKYERLVEYRTQSFTMNFRLKLLLFVRKQIDFHVRIWSASHVQSGEVFGLNYCHRQTVRIEVVFKLKYNCWITTYIYIITHALVVRIFKYVDIWCIVLLSWLPIYFSVFLLLFFFYFFVNWLLYITLYWSFPSFTSLTLLSPSSGSSAFSVSSSISGCTCVCDLSMINHEHLLIGSQLGFKLVLNSIKVWFNLKECEHGQTNSVKNDILMK